VLVKLETNKKSNRKSRALTTDILALFGTTSACVAEAACLKSW
jgi:hypothetical protein